MKKLLTTIIALIPLAVFSQTNIILSFTPEQLQAIAWRVSVLNQKIQAENVKIVEYNSKLQATTNETTGEVVKPEPMKTNELFTVETFIAAKITPVAQTYFNAVMNDLVKRYKEANLLTDEQKQKLIESFVNADAATRSNIINALKLGK